MIFDFFDSLLICSFRTPKNMVSHLSVLKQQIWEENCMKDVDSFLCLPKWSYQLSKISFPSRKTDSIEGHSRLPESVLFKAISFRTVGIEKFQVTTIYQYSKLNRHFSFGGVLAFFSFKKLLTISIGWYIIYV